MIHRICIVLLCVLVLAAPACRADAFKDAAAALDRGDLIDAERILRDNLQTHPSDQASLSLLGVVLDQERKFEQATAIYTRALAAAPPGPSLLNNYGNHLLSVGDDHAAEQVFTQVLRLDPSQQNANLQLARLDIRQKEFHQARLHLARLDQQTLKQPAVALLQLQALFGSGETIAASSLLTVLETQAASDPRLAFSLGLALASAGQYRSAENEFSSVLEQAPGDFDVLYNLGLAASQAGDKQRALHVLEIAQQRRPDDVDVLYNLAVVCGELNQKDAALAWLARAGRLDPSRAEVQMLIARLSSELGYDKDALAAWDHYLALKPNDDEARRDQALVAAIMGEYGQSMTELTAYVARHPNDPVGHYDLAVASSFTQPAESMREFDRALALNPRFTAALADRGWLYFFQRNDVSHALADLERANQILRNNPIILDRIGEIDLRMDEIPQALSALRQAQQLAPQNSTIALHLARALARSGDRHGADAMLAVFRKLGPQTQRHGGLVQFFGLPPAERYSDFRARVETAAANDPTDMQTQLDYLSILLNEGKTDAAKSVTARIEAGDASGDILYRAGRAWMDAGDNTVATGLLKKAVLAAHAPGDAALDLAIARYRTDGAQQGLEQLNAIPPQQRGANYLLAMAEMLDAMGETPQAVLAMNQALNESPGRPALYRDATLLLLKHQRISGAVEFLDAAAKKLPNSPDILLMKAIALELDQRSSDSGATLRAIEDRWPEWAQVWLVHAILLEQDSHYEESLQMVDTALALGAQGPEAWYCLADSIYYSAPNRMTEAADAIRKDLTLAPDDPWAHLLAGRIAARENDDVSAVRELEAAIKLNPHLAQAHYALARVYRAQGRDAESEAEIQQFKSVEKNFPEGGNDISALRRQLFEVRVAADQ